MRKLKNTGERMIPEYHRGQNKYGAHIARYQAALELSKDKVVLDIACGSGYGSKMLSSVAKKVYGIDNSNESVEYAKRSFASKRVEYLVGDAVAIPLEDKSVDIVVSFETIEHVPDSSTFLKEVKRVIKPDGSLILSTPNKTQSSGGNEFHYREFSYFEIKGLVDKFFKNRVDYYQSLWLYNSILPLSLLSADWREPIDTTSTAPIKVSESEFFYMICSDSDIKSTIKPQGVISQHYSQREAYERLRKSDEKYHALYKEKLELEQFRAVLQNKLNKIEGSKSWRIARAIQIFSSTLRAPMRIVKRIISS